MNQEEINYIIKQILEFKKIVTFNEFITVINNFGKIYINKEPNAKFIITQLPTYSLGICTGTKKIEINISVIKELYNGNKFSLLTIYHELGHFTDYYNIKNSIYSDYILKVLKEHLIRKYIVEENINKRIGIIEGNYYYYDNYSVNTSELSAETYACKEFLKYFEIIALKISAHEMSIIKSKQEQINLNKKINTRNLKNVAIFNSNQKNINNLFDEIINYHPEYIYSYPLLTKEYYVDKNQKIRKRS